MSPAAPVTVMTTSHEDMISPRPEARPPNPSNRRRASGERSAPQDRPAGKKHQHFSMAIPAAPSPITPIRQSRSGLGAAVLSAFKSADVTTHGRPVLVVMENRDVDPVLNPCLDIEAAGRGNVFELDRAECRGNGHDRLDDGSTSLVSRRIGIPDKPHKVSIRLALPSMTGMAARGPISPSPRTAVPSVTMATK